MLQCHSKLVTIGAHTVYSIGSIGLHLYDTTLHFIFNAAWQTLIKSRKINTRAKPSGIATKCAVFFTVYNDFSFASVRPWKVLQMVHNQPNGTVSKISNQYIMLHFTSRETIHSKYCRRTFSKSWDLCHSSKLNLTAAERQGVQLEPITTVSCTWMQRHYPHLVRILALEPLLFLHIAFDPSLW